MPDFFKSSTYGYTVLNFVKVYKPEYYVNVKNYIIERKLYDYMHINYNDFLPEDGVYKLNTSFYGSVYTYLELSKEELSAIFSKDILIYYTSLFLFIMNTKIKI